MISTTPNPIPSISADGAALATSKDAVQLDDLAQIIEAYSLATERMQQSHERLQEEVVRLRRELTSANAQLQRSKRLSALGEMAAGIAHEIRNPLAAIQLYLGMVGEDLAGPEPSADLALDNVRKISSAVQGMSAIVNDVLSFARGIEPRVRPAGVADIFDRVLASHRPGIDHAKVRVVRRDLGQGELRIDADAGLLQQALLNLVRNAVDAMASSEASAERVLTLDAEADEAGCTLVVADSGPGIPKGSIDRIFNPFFTTRSTGTGLGLAIVHRIVDAHGGSVTIVNDGGAVFRLSLPWRSSATQHEHRRLQPPPATGAAA
ncbi:MAG: ATP-binding protein [Planctomycetota bacterium]